MKIWDFFKKKKSVTQEIKEDPVTKKTAKIERDDPFSSEKKLLEAKKDGYRRDNILYSKYIEGQTLVKSEAVAENPQEISYVNHFTYSTIGTNNPKPPKYTLEEVLQEKGKQYANGKCEILDVISDNGILSIIIDRGEQGIPSSVYQETISSAGSGYNSWTADIETKYSVSTSKATKVSFIRNQEKLFSYLMDGHQDSQSILESLKQIKGEDRLYADLFEKYAIKMDALAQKKLQEEKYKETKQIIIKNTQYIIVPEEIGKNIWKRKVSR